MSSAVTKTWIARMISPRRFSMRGVFSAGVSELWELSPAREAQPRAGPGRRAIARHIFEPVEVEVLDRAGERDPVEDFRAAGMQLVARQRLQEFRVLVGASFQDGAIEFLVH